MTGARLVHMASMARSGETMLLNTLNKHSRIKIAGQLEDTIEGQRRLKLFKTWELSYIDTAHPLFADLGLNESDIVIIKQGIWEHPWAFEGFILVRNPVSIYASLMRYDHVALRSLEGILHYLGMSSAKRRLKGNYWRFYRWFRDVDIDLYDRLDSLNVLDLFCCFYNRRMGRLLDLGLPVVHYEHLVSEPEAALDKLCSMISVPFESGMLDVRSSKVGHGKNDLGRAISDISLYQVDNLRVSEINQVLTKTCSTWRRYGYELQDGRLVLPNG
jgi:hypothetical protein